MLIKYDGPVGKLVKDIAIRAGGCGLDSQAGRIEHGVAKVSPTLQHFFVAVLSSTEMGPATLHTSA